MLKTLVTKEISQRYSRHSILTIFLKQTLNVRCQSTKAAAESSEKDPRPLYLDAQATTPIDPRVLDAMLPHMTNMYGNPHSRTHAFGWESEKAVEHAREVNENQLYCSLI